MADLDGKLTKQSELLTQLVQAKEATHQTLAKRQQALDSLLEVITQAKQVAQQVADPQLNKDVTSLQTIQLSLATQLNNEQLQATQQQAEFQAAQMVLQQQEQERAELDTKLKTIAARKTELAELAAARDTASAETKLSHKRLHQAWERRFTVRGLIPLSPEQLAGNTISALELTSRYQLEAAAQWQTKHQEDKAEEIDDAKKTTEIQELLQQRLAQVTNTYIALFAPPEGSPQDLFSATTDQALFFANDKRMQQWLQPAEGSLLKRLNTIENADVIADEMHLAILSRPATSSEKSELKKYLSARKEDRQIAIREITWGLLSSLEFRFLP